MKLPTTIHLDPLKADWYDACVILTDLNITKKRWTLEVTFAITNEAEGYDIIVKESYIMYDEYNDKLIIDGCEKLMKMATACGIEHQLDDTDQLFDRQLMIKVGITTNNGIKKNVIKDYAPIIK